MVAGGTGSVIPRRAPPALAESILPASIFSPTNNVGVVTTPARTPDSKSARTRARDPLAAPVGLEALEVQPELDARFHRCGSSRRP